MGRAPDQREEQLRIGAVREAGPVADGLGNLELRLSPGRADWLLGPSIPPDVQVTAIPNLGDVESALARFGELVFARAAAAYEAPRFALGVIVMQPAESKEASYAELGKLVPQMRDYLGGASDFVYQINRPRRSRVFPEMMLNRLTRWSSVSLTGVQVFVALTPEGQVTRRPERPILATRVEMDVNTAADWPTPIPRDVREPLLRELLGLSLEIVSRGDVQ